MFLGLIVACTDKPPKHVCVFKQLVYDSQCRALITNREKVKQATVIRDSLIGINANPEQISKWQEKIDRQDSLAERHFNVIIHVLGSTKCELLLSPVCP